MAGAEKIEINIPVVEKKKKKKKKKREKMQCAK